MSSIPRLPFLGLAVALTAASFPAAAATRLEIQGGRSYMDGHGSNTAFVEAVFDEHRLGATRFSWSPDVSLGWIGGRDLARYRGADPPSISYLDVVITKSPPAERVYGGAAT